MRKQRIILAISKIKELKRILDRKKRGDIRCSIR